MTTLLAPAKLTTSLRVLGRRSDGMHLVRAEMVSVDLCDEIELDEQGDGLAITDEVDWSGLPGTAPAAVPPVGRNLVERALSLAGRQAHCVLRKRIPAGAGLGGGSSDAAAVLRWAGVDDPLTASRLGADVPFCLRGGRARVSGIGEVVEPLGDGGGTEEFFLLVTPRLHVATPEVYRAWDDLGGPSGDAGNDLEPAALSVYPGLRWWRDVLAAAAGERPRLAGSGGTWFLEGDAERLGQLRDEVRAEIVAGRESALVAVVRGMPPAGG